MVMLNDPYRVAYANAEQRCNNHKVKSYHRYGGRGIEFRFNSFEEFRAAVGTRPNGVCRLDRINNDGHYEAGNLRWVSPSQSRINQAPKYQQGYLFEKHGAFYVRYYKVIEGVRKQKAHRLCSKDRQIGCGSVSAKAVRQLCDEFMREVNVYNEVPNAALPLTVVAFWESTYLPFIEQNLKHSTVWGYKQVWGQHLSGHFGSTLLKDYKTPMMSNFLTKLAKTLRPRTLAHIKNLASGIFAHAVGTGSAEMNPVRDAIVLGRTLENGQTKAYSLEEAAQVIDALVDRVDCQLMMALAFFAGLRKGEIQGLKWEDFDGERLRITRAFGRGVLGTPKTLKSVRTVPVIEPLRVLLGLWQRKSGHSSGWVFPSETGSAKGLDRVADKVIRPALERAGVPWKGYHACRRGLGTTLRSLTGNSNAGRDVLGHSTTQVTEAHYEDRMPEEMLKGMRLLEAKVKV